MITERFVDNDRTPGAHYLAMMVQVITTTIIIRRKSQYQFEDMDRHVGRVASGVSPFSVPTYLCVLQV
jgi:hypothetical protein